MVNSLYGISMNSSMVQNMVYGGRRENTNLEGNRYEEVEAETGENIVYESVVEHTGMETEESTAMDGTENSEPLVVNGYSQLQRNGMDSCPTGALPAREFEDGREYCVLPIRSESDSYSHLQHKY